MNKRNLKTKFYNVAIDYRTVGFPGALISTVRADSEDEAIEAAAQSLRDKYINLKIDRSSVTLSGWSR